MAERDKNALNIEEGDWEEGHKNSLNDSCKGLLLLPKAVKISFVYLFLRQNFNFGKGSKWFMI